MANVVEEMVGTRETEAAEMATEFGGAVATESGGAATTGDETWRRLVMRRRRTVR